MYEKKDSKNKHDWIFVKQITCYHRHIVQVDSEAVLSRRRPGKDNLNCYNFRRLICKHCPYTGRNLSPSDKAQSEDIFALLYQRSPLTGSTQFWNNWNVTNKLLISFCINLWNILIKDLKNLSYQDISIEFEKEMILLNSLFL